MSGAVSHAAFQPLQGQLVPLRTKHEIQASNDTVSALVIALPKRLASKAVGILKPLQPPSQPSQPTLQHLRRFADTTHLPQRLRSDYESSTGSSNGTPDVIHFLILPPLPLDHDAVIAAFRSHVDSSFPLVLQSLQVPTYPPISQEQAAMNTMKYWPCSYNPAAQIIQHAPPYQTLRLITGEISTGKWHVGHYMRLAQLAADHTSTTAIGRRCGAVAVDSGTGAVVAIAGDGRWLSAGNEDKNDEGRPEHHALMRLIAMVAAKERRGRALLDVEARSGMDVAISPLTPIEKQFLEHEVPHIDGYPPTSSFSPIGNTPEELGYLCANLDVYLTHEPCVMCSMGMVHSRFRVCVFGQRMRGTGGLCAEMADGGVGYGLCWRKELNWRTITFQYESQEDPSDLGSLFHA